MSNTMTFMADRYAVGNIISQCGIFSPRFNMMCLNSFTRITILASPIIPFINGISPVQISRLFVKFIAHGRSASSPIWMTWPNKVCVKRRTATGSLRTYTNRFLVLRGQLASFIGFTDAFNSLQSCLWSHKLLLSICLFGILRYFCSYIRSLCYIISQVPISHFARIRAKLLTAAFIFSATLETRIYE